MYEAKMKMVGQAQVRSTLECESTSNCYKNTFQDTCLPFKILRKRTEQPGHFLLKVIGRFVFEARPKTEFWLFLARSAKGCPNVGAEVPGATKVLLKRSERIALVSAVVGLMMLISAQQSHTALIREYEYIGTMWPHHALIIRDIYLCRSIERLHEKGDSTVFVPHA